MSCTVKTAPKNEYELFRNIIYPYVNQNLALIIVEMYDYITSENKEKHEFICLHPESQWIMKEIQYVFDVIALPLFNNTNQNHIQQRLRIVQYAQSIIKYRVEDKLYRETAGIDSSFINALSGENYESKEVKKQKIVILPYVNSQELKLTNSIEFDENNQYELTNQNVHTIRKLLNLTGENFALAITKDYCRENYITVGLIPEARANGYPYFEFKKGMSWEYCVPVANASDAGKKANRCIMSYYRGMLKLPLQDVSTELKKELYGILKKNLAQSAEETSCRMAGIISSLDQCESGAILIFGQSKYIDVQAQEYAKKKRGMLLKPCKSLANTNSRNIKRFSNIDGALLVDFNGKCHACGVILDGVVQSEGNFGRGSRFNSTKAFVETQEINSPDELIIGVVKSEDGMLDIFYSHQSQQTHT